MRLARGPQQSRIQSDKTPKTDGQTPDTHETSRLPPRSGLVQQNRRLGPRAREFWAVLDLIGLYWYFDGNRAGLSDRERETGPESRLVAKPCGKGRNDDELRASISSGWLLTRVERGVRGKVKSSPIVMENVKLAREILSFGQLIWRERNDLKCCGQVGYGVNRREFSPRHYVWRANRRCESNPAFATVNSTNSQVSLPRLPTGFSCCSRLCCRTHPMQ
jgi:hypothetical protein